MRRKIIASGIIGILFGVGIFSICNISGTNNDNNDLFLSTDHFADDYSYLYENVLTPPPVPTHIEFCGEPVPMHQYWVRECIDRELINQCYQHSRTLLTLKRSTRFLPVIEKILKEENVPGDLMYLCIAESNLENVVSAAKAAGFWQFMESTGNSYGLEINEWVDERYHLEKATQVACIHLKKLKAQFGNWALAAAAYNMGENGLAKKIKEQQIDNYWDLYLNQETARYLSRCIAYKLIFENQKLYNIRISEEDFYKPFEYKEVVITKTIEDLRTYCNEHNILYRQLKELNPWLRSTKLPVHANKNYTIKVP